MADIDVEEREPVCRIEPIGEPVVEALDEKPVEALDDKSVESLNEKSVETLNEKPVEPLDKKHVENTVEADVPKGEVTSESGVGETSDVPEEQAEQAVVEEIDDFELVGLSPESHKAKSENQQQKNDNCETKKSLEEELKTEEEQEEKSLDQEEKPAEDTEDKSDAEDDNHQHNRRRQLSEVYLSAVLNTLYVQYVKSRNLLYSMYPKK